MPHLKSAIQQNLRIRFNPKSIVLLNAVLFALCAMPLPLAHAAEVTLGWDSNPEPDLEGYVVYSNVGSPGPPYDYSDTLPEDDLVDPLHPKATLTELKEGQEYYIALTAYNTDGIESNFSNDVCVQVINGVVEACTASVAPVASTISSAGGNGSNNSCFISASSAESSMFSKFVAGPISRSHVLAITLLLLFLATAVRSKSSYIRAHSR